MANFPTQASAPCFRPIDGDGARIVWILKARQGGGLRRLWGVVSEREGLVGVTRR